MAMTALPAFAVPLVLDWWLLFSPASGSAATDASFQELAEYFARIWVHGDFPPEL